MSITKTSFKRISAFSISALLLASATVTPVHAAAKHYISMISNSSYTQGLNKDNCADGGATISFGNATITDDDAVKFSIALCAPNGMNKQSEVKVAKTSELTNVNPNHLDTLPGETPTIESSASSTTNGSAYSAMTQHFIYSNLDDDDDYTVLARMTITTPTTINPTTGESFAGAIDRTGVIAFNIIAGEEPENNTKSSSATPIITINKEDGSFTYTDESGKAAENGGIARISATIRKNDTDANGATDIDIDTSNLHIEGNTISGISPITSLDPNSEYTLSVYVEYGNGTHETHEVIFTTDANGNLDKIISIDGKKVDDADATSATDSTKNPATLDPIISSIIILFGIVLFCFSAVKYIKLSRR
jgi:hypothetical protein